ncbi:hypothetical protein SISNIDRAFT_461207 [Sistotremastrum niveocremeum HHB9708]|uniref:Uncharacterized protein n=2 Tax=Sistotremastraceae TaxID=3402574 RepID=A0A164MWN8_9AGAM|nr:hypothetical protein SISNIDRAFT_461207 [Sistotremastrum niveocremeum HHB9708]KZT32460.1 hypothetical protein SISSUDRAFT_1055493 [Sistotremastrum suecicum HHB10207 ss-3]
MPHFSPAATLSWSIYAAIFEVFLLAHLYRYDKFQCIRWKSGRQPGTFKRVMTYSYLGTVPLILFYAVAMTVIKYRQGYVSLPLLGVVPKPYPLWPKDDQHWILPLFFVIAIAWGLEVTTHLEELMFWHFLINQGPAQRSWFNSGEFRLWCIGSTVAVMGMPLVTLVTRRDYFRCEAWIFLVGSIGSTLTTLAFFLILYRFPSFIRQVKGDGADPTVVARLETFHYLNIVRVFFRFLFTIPLIVLSSDGIRNDAHPVNENMFAVDLCIMSSGLGCILSSAITLLIFFPHSTSTTISATTPDQNAPVNSQYQNNRDSFILATKSHDGVIFQPGVGPLSPPNMTPNEEPYELDGHPITPLSPPGVTVTEIHPRELAASELEESQSRRRGRAMRRGQREGTYEGRDGDEGDEEGADDEYASGSGSEEDDESEGEGEMIDDTHSSSKRDSSLATHPPAQIHSRHPPHPQIIRHHPSRSPMGRPSPSQSRRTSYQNLQPHQILQLQQQQQLHWRRSGGMGYPVGVAVVDVETGSSRSLAMGRNGQSPERAIDVSWRMSTGSHYMNNYTSPIDFVDYPDEPVRGAV